MTMDGKGWTAPFSEETTRRIKRGMACYAAGASRQPDDLPVIGKRLRRALWLVVAVVMLAAAVNAASAVFDVAWSFKALHAVVGGMVLGVGVWLAGVLRRSPR